MPQKACFRELGGVQNLLRPLTWHLFTKVKICTVGKRRKQIKLTPYQLFHSVSVEATLFFSPSNHRPSNFFSLFIQPPSLPNCKKSVYETKNLGFNLYLFRCFIIFVLMPSSHPIWPQSDHRKAFKFHLVLMTSSLSRFPTDYGHIDRPLVTDDLLRRAGQTDYSCYLGGIWFLLTKPRGFHPSQSIL